METTSGLGDQLTQLAAFDIPLDKLQTYVADVSAVTPDQVKAVAARLYDPKNANIVVVGDGAVFFNALKKKRPTLSASRSTNSTSTARRCSKARGREIVPVRQDRRDRMTRG